MKNNSNGDKIQEKSSPIDFKIRLIKVQHLLDNAGINIKLTLSYFAGIHSRSKKRIHDALNGKAPNLLSKMDRHLDILELRANKRNLAQINTTKNLEEEAKEVNR